METMQHSEQAEIPEATTLDADLTRIREAKYDYGLEKSVCDWIVEIIGVAKPANEKAAVWMKSGDILCSLMNCIRGGTIKKYNVNTTSRFKQMENITLFLRACREVGVLEKDLFSTIDLFEEKNMNSVILCLFNLGGTIQSTIPYFTGPKLGIKQNRKFDIVPQLVFTKPAPRTVTPIVSPPKVVEPVPRLSLPRVEPVTEQPVPPVIDLPPVDPIPLPFNTHDVAPPISVAALLRKDETVVERVVSPPPIYVPPAEKIAPVVIPVEPVARLVAPTVVTEKTPAVVKGMKVIPKAEELIDDIQPRKRSALVKRVANHSFNNTGPNMANMQSMPNVAAAPGYVSGGYMGNTGGLGASPIVPSNLFPSSFVPPQMVQPSIGPYQGYGSNLLRQVSSSHQVQFSAPRNYLIPADGGADLDRCVLSWVGAILSTSVLQLDSNVLDRLAGAILSISPNPNIRLSNGTRIVELARMLGVADADLGNSTRNVFALGGVLQNYEWWVNSKHPQLGRRIKIVKK